MQVSFKRFPLEVVGAFITEECVSLLPGSSPKEVLGNTDRAMYRKEGIIVLVSAYDQALGDMASPKRLGRNWATCLIFCASVSPSGYYYSSACMVSTYRVF